jgi:hypothetical protein
MMTLHLYHYIHICSHTYKLLPTFVCLRVVDLFFFRVCRECEAVSHTYIHEYHYDKNYLSNFRCSPNGKEISGSKKNRSMHTQIRSYKCTTWYVSIHHQNIHVVCYLKHPTVEVHHYPVTLTFLKPNKHHGASEWALPSPQ